MRVILLNTNEKVTVEDHYGARLIEQGKAVAIIEKPVEEKPAEKPVEKKPAKTTGKE